MKRCPFCAEEIQDAAIVCRFCGRDLSATRTEGQGAVQQPTQAAQRGKALISRVIAKACHVLVFGWTAYLGLSMIGSLASLNTSSGASVLGATLGLGLVALMWFVPVVVLELVAIGLTLSSRGTESDGRREWIIGTLLASPLLLLFLVALAGSSTSGRRADPAAGTVSEPTAVTLSMTPTSESLVVHNGGTALLSDCVVRVGPFTYRLGTVSSQAAVRYDDTAWKARGAARVSERAVRLQAATSPEVTCRAPDGTDITGVRPAAP